MPDIDQQIHAMLLQRINDEFDCAQFRVLLACAGGFLVVFHDGRGLLFRTAEGDIGIQEIEPELVAEALENHGLED